SALTGDQATRHQTVHDIGDGGLTELKRGGHSAWHGLPTPLNLLQNQDLRRRQTRGPGEPAAMPVRRPQDSADGTQRACGEVVFHTATPTPCHKSCNDKMLRQSKDLDAQNQAASAPTKIFKVETAHESPTYGPRNESSGFL